MTTTVLLCILISTICGVAGQFILKQGMSQIGQLSLSPEMAPMMALRMATSPLVILGLAVYGLGTFFWLIALSRVPLSFAYPFVSLSYILIFLISWLNGEAINVVRLAGTLTIVVGVLLIAKS